MKVHNTNNLPTIPIADLLPTQGNLKDLTEVNYKKLKSIIERRGFSYPVYVWEDKDGLLHLLDGHQRQRVLTTEGWNEPIPYLKVPAKDLQEAMARLLEITSQYATITQEGIDTFIAKYELNEAEVYESTSFDALGSYGSEEEPEIEEDEAPEVSDEPPVSKLGEVYQLGRHRVMCGSCQEEENLTKLFGSENPRMVVTSPPYADAREYNIGKFDWDELMNDLSNTFHEFNDCDMIINLGQLHRDGKVWFYWSDWLEHMEKCGYPLFGMYVWDKLNAVPGEYNGRLSQAHEWIFHFRTNNTGSAKKTEKTKGFAKTGTFRQTDGSLKRATSPDKINQGVKIKESVIRIAPEKNNQSGHPAVYSVAFANELMESWSSGGDLIYDPFTGSGTTIIACEQTDRTCYGMELDPKYVDVIRKRYAKFISPDNELPENWEELTPAIAGV